jgi:hypothetical protein
MLVTMVNSTYGGNTQSWASVLVKEIKTGSYKSAALPDGSVLQHD